MENTKSSLTHQNLLRKEHELVSLQEYLTEFNDPAAVAADLRNIYYKLTSYLLQDNDFLHGDRDLSEALDRLWILQEVIEDMAV